jgi:CrcB protein
MIRFLLVCLGGALGSGARYWVALEAPRLFGTGFPYATLIVNVLGSFLLGALVRFAATTSTISTEMRLLLATGVLGGFTTYSTFNHETVEYLRAGSYGLAGLNVAATLLACLLAGALGIVVARWVVGG